MAQVMGRQYAIYGGASTQDITLQELPWAE